LGDSASGDLIDPVSLGVRNATYNIPYPVGPSGQFLSTPDPAGGFTISDDRDPRSAGLGFTQDAAMDFRISSLASGSATLRLSIAEVLLNRSPNVFYSLPLDVTLFKGSGVVTLADFPSLPNGGAEYLLAVGDYSSSPYELNVDVSTYVSSLLASGSSFLGVYLHTYVPGAAIGEPLFQFSGAVLNAPFVRTPEPSTLLMSVGGCVIAAVAAILARLLPSFPSSVYR
jgi:hypothetical protein